MTKIIPKKGKEKYLNKTIESNQANGSKIKVRKSKKFEIYIFRDKTYFNKMYHMKNLRCILRKFYKIEYVLC